MCKIQKILTLTIPLLLFIFLLFFVFGLRMGYSKGYTDGYLDAILEYGVAPNCATYWRSVELQHKKSKAQRLDDYSWLRREQ